MDMSLADPKGLIRESYAIAGITAPECRSIFLDWALGVGAGIDAAEAIRALVAHYALDRPDHPMSKVLSDGLTAPARPARRGGRSARVEGSGQG